MTRDVAKISKALERPGIDPRKFVELAIVTTVAVDGNGVHADVLTSDGLPETAALVTPYGGPGYGFYGPIDLDDAVLLAVPDGKYNAGARVVGRVWDAGSPPPAEVSAHPDDVALVVKPGQTIRIVVSGGGNAVIEARDGGKLLLGSEAATSAALLGTPYRTSEDTFFGAIGALSTALGVYAAAIKVIADPTNAATAVLNTALTAFQTQLSAFSAGASSYLSTKVKLI